MEACTWTPEEGPNELRPINCVNVWAALAFCAWDGKQLLSEIAWEYLARNRGTTEVPFGDSRNNASVCNLADVGGWVTAAGGRTLCPSTPLPLSVFDRPDDVTTDPPGIHGLFGGVAEYVRRSVYNPPGIALRNRQMCFGRRTDLIVDGQVETWSGGNVTFIVPVVQINTRGASWFDRNEFEPHRFSASLVHNSATTAAEGFRCGRSERPVR